MAPYAPVLRPPRLGRRGAILAPAGRLEAAAPSEPKGLVGWIELGVLPNQDSLAGKLGAGKFPSSSPQPPRAYPLSSFEEFDLREEVNGKAC
jgi:hypothetical protein